MDAMFLKFADDLDNLTGGSLSVSDNLANERILLINSPGMEKPISLCVVHFSQAIGVCVQKTFPVRCHQWTDVDGDYIEVVKDNVQWFFVLDFNDQAMNRHFKKYNDLEEVHATQPNLLMVLAQPSLQSTRAVAELPAASENPSKPISARRAFAGAARLSQPSPEAEPASPFAIRSRSVSQPRPHHRRSHAQPRRAASIRRSAVETYDLSDSTGSSHPDCPRSPLGHRRLELRSYGSACCTCSGTCQRLGRGRGKGKGKLASDQK
ncbi:CACTA en-spm transposon protein [Cucumis melo var. makuwa]|uniref:CACTA en-spm transposon protein n=1 Tax=Cucumis melo var. makuwa TaxID=1194695 RepID=A0A5A7TFL4_CUCMM|nr:CACTA en-spm transposon protein [Cucumis melo var. makuwa]